MKATKLYILIFLFLGCAGTKNDRDISVKQAFEQGLNNLDNEKYLKAQADFKSVLVKGGGTDIADDAQYYLGVAYFRNKEYLLAIAEFEKLSRRMGYSPFVEDARFKICESYRIESPEYFHDQEYTQKAIERYQEFLDDYPNSKFNKEATQSIKTLRKKLAEKLYNTGLLYIKLEEYNSAKIFFQSIIDEYYDTDIVIFAHQGMVKSLARNREIEDAIAYLDKYEKELDERKLFIDANKTIDMMKKVISKGK